MRAVFVLCVLTAACGPTMDERQPAGAARATSYLNALTKASKTPGIQYVVVNATDVVFEYASGWANIRRQVPVDTATTMMAYSMSKTITAVAVLQLVEGGKVGLDDPVERYVDSWPYGASVTVRQLISHTSGIPNPIPLRWVHPGARHGSFDENAALASVLRDRPRLSFEPGTRYAYSNIGYWPRHRLPQKWTLTQPRNLRRRSEFGGSLVREKTAVFCRAPVGATDGCRRGRFCRRQGQFQGQSKRNRESRNLHAGVYLGKPAAVRWPSG